MVIGQILATVTPVLDATDFGITLVINAKGITPTMNVPPQIDDLLTINENGGRYKHHLPVLVWMRKTADNQPEMKMYYVGIEKQEGKWYITDWD